MNTGAPGTIFIIEVQGPSPPGSLTLTPGQAGHWTQPWLTQSSDPQCVAGRIARPAQGVLSSFILKWEVLSTSKVCCKCIERMILYL